VWVCFSVREHISKTTPPNLTKFSVHIRRRRAPRLDESIVRGVSGVEYAMHHCLVDKARLHDTNTCTYHVITGFVSHTTSHAKLATVLRPTLTQKITSTQFCDKQVTRYCPGAGRYAPADCSSTVAYRFAAIQAIFASPSIQTSRRIYVRPRTCQQSAHL